ncbi:MAG TPA: FtsX-like permease family protein [Solirubrobacteraceae bacterium]|nr:FtsX-like permease family protein [Solirubrobacteraceae bacterium]
MAKVAVRGLFARKLRFALTLLAVALGVALIAATYIFTDTINASFDRIFTASAKGTDASITPHQAITTGDSSTQQTIPASVLRAVRADPQVLVASGDVFDAATVLGRNGKRIGNGGAPNFVTSVSAAPRFQASKAKQGRLPRTADEAAIDAATARKQGFKLGDKLAIQGAAPRTDYTLVGFTQIAGVDSFGGATVVNLTLPEAQRMLGKGTSFDSISAAAKPGVTPEALVRGLRAQLPRTVDVRTGKAEAAKQSQDLRKNLGFLRTILLVFAGISLFVGSFIIFNSFSITVQQRIRELGLLRTIGASRRQLLVLVVSEGFLLGIAGSLLGILLGLALAPGLRALFRAVGADLPASGLVVEPRTVYVPLIVGTLVAVFSSLVPAIRATRVSPMASLQVAAAPALGRVSRRTTILAGVLGVAGVALMLRGLFGSGSANSALAALGFGVAATFIAVALLSPWLVRPLASLMGRPVQRLAGFPGRLARENAVRQPARTASTAAALMVGVALVTFASVFAAGARATIENAVRDNFKGAFVVTNADGFSPYSARALGAVRAVPGVGAVSGVRFTTGKVGRSKVSVTGIEPATFPQLYATTVKKGPRDAVARLVPGSVLVSKSYADGHHVKLGDTLRVFTPTRATLALRVSAVVEDKGGLLAQLTVPTAVVLRKFDEPKVGFGLVGLAPGAGSVQVHRAIDAVLKARYPQAEAKTAKQFIGDQAAQVNQLLGLIYALLSLAIIVSLFGIVNTLVLSISERTREIGMLRAVGTTRRQVRQIVRWEAVITALIGGLLGCVMGLVLAVLFTRPLENFPLTVPIGTLIVLVVLSGLAGVLAATFPARRAARLDVLEALAYE